MKFAPDSENPDDSPTNKLAIWPSRGGLAGTHRGPRPLQTHHFFFAYEHPWVSNARVGISREGKAGHDAAVLRDWEFFRAPLAGIVCMHRHLGTADALVVGMYLADVAASLCGRETIEKNVVFLDN